MSDEPLRGLGHIADTFDPRDRVFAGGLRPRGALPTENTSLVRLAPPVVDQGEEGSCTGRALSRAACVVLRAHVDPNTPPLSSHFPYALGRRLEVGRTGKLSDDGAMPRFVCSAYQKWGSCAEADWPDTTDVNADPDFHAFLKAAKYRVVSYSAIRPAAGVARSTACAEAIDAGHPVCIALPVDERFDKWWGEPLTAAMEVRNPSTEIRGMHYVCLLGFRFIGGELQLLMCNSWGTSWGEGGYAWLTAERIDDVVATDARFVEARP